MATAELSGSPADDDLDALAAELNIDPAEDAPPPDLEAMAAELELEGSPVKTDDEVAADLEAMAAELEVETPEPAAKSSRLAGAVNSLEDKTGLDLDGDGDVGEDGTAKATDADR